MPSNNFFFNFTPPLYFKIMCRLLFDFETQFYVEGENVLLYYIMYYSIIELVSI